MKRKFMVPFVLPLALLCLTACGENETYQNPLQPVRVQSIKTHRMSQPIGFAGHITPDVQVRLAFKVGGYVESIKITDSAQRQGQLIQEGDHVKKGDVLAVIRQKDYQAKVNQAGSSLAQAKAQMHKISLDYKRYKVLYQKKDIPKARYDEIKAGLLTAKAKLDGAKAQLETAQIALTETHLTAPMDAVVIKRNVEIGVLASPGLVGFVLADMKKVKAVFGVPQSLRVDLKLGQTVLVFPETYSGVGLKAYISSIAPSADPTSRIFQVEAMLPNKDGFLISGQIVTIKLPQSKAGQNKALIPLNAVVRPENDPKGYAVFVLETKDNKTYAKLKKVTLGQIEGNRISVVKGLKHTDKVIVDGASLAKNGVEVRVIP